MKNNGLLTEQLGIKAEMLTVTSAAGATSKQYDMSKHQQGAIVCVLNGNGSATPVTLDLMESSAASAAGTSALGGKGGIQVGSSANTAVAVANGVRALTLTGGTAGTGATGDAITISVGSRTRTFVFSTSTALHNSSAWSDTRAYFGSTVGSTVDTGPQLTMGMLSSELLSTWAFGSALVCSTPATNTLTITLADGATGNLAFGATGSTAFVVASDWTQAVGAFNFAADELKSTASKKFVSVKISTAATSVRAGINVIRTGARYASSTFAGNVSTVNFTT